MKNERTHILVIGSGIAGLYYALKCADFAQVTIITKAKIRETNTMLAQGGIAAVMNAKDSIESHLQDTLLAGDGLCDETAVRIMVENARETIENLQRFMVQFDKGADNSFDLHREGGHSAARVVHTADATGMEVENKLVEAVLKNPAITVYENHFAVDLCIVNNCCEGALVLDGDSHPLHIQANVVMLATGGAGQVYEQNTNPKIATGDGFAIANRAGAKLANMEFVQFHPTMLYAPGKPSFLITEALRGAGAELRTSDGIAFMNRYHPMKSLAPRDIVSRAIVTEINRLGDSCAYLDITNVTDDLATHFPTILNRCKQEGIALPQQFIPVVPAAHYMCGGVLTDTYGRTSVGRLYACGETSCTGVHGANRLASNSLLEGLIFAARAAEATQQSLNVPIKYEFTAVLIVGQISSENSLTETFLFLQQLMWQHAGIIRNRKGLQYCIEQLKISHQSVAQNIARQGITPENATLLNAIQTSLLIANAALTRRESRGCHYRNDFFNPTPNTVNCEQSIYE
jgi:L-aspartate oxidase